MLSQIPYKTVEHETIAMPKRVHNANYLRGPIPKKMYVPRRTEATPPADHTSKSLFSRSSVTRHKNEFADTPSTTRWS